MQIADKSKLEDVILERSYLKGLMTFFDSAEAHEALLKTKTMVFSSTGRVEVFNAITSLYDRKIKYSIETVGVELYGKGVDAEFVEILKTEETPNFIFILGALSNLAKARRSFVKLLEAANDLLDKKSVTSTLQAVSYFVDEELVDNTEGLETYAEIKERVQNAEPQALYPTGITGLDKELKLPLGTFGCIIAKPELGKSLMLNQMAEEFAKSDINAKAMICPFEFSAENYVRQKIGNDEYFDHNKLYIEDRAVELDELKIKILQAIRKGVVFIGIDSQMSLQNSSHTGRDEGLESKKFEMLSSLAIRYNVIIFLIAQEKIDAKKGTIYGSSKASYLPKIIFYIDWEDKEQTKRIISTTKNKITHKVINFEVTITPKTGKFKRVYENMQGTVGRKAQGDGKPFEVIYEEGRDSDGKYPETLELPHI